MEGGIDMEAGAQPVEDKPTPAQDESGEDNKFQTAIGAWRSMYTHKNTVYHATDKMTLDIDLTTLIPQLDTVASDIVAHQRDTLTQRKDLAQKTKDFRKLDDASKLSDIKALLKCTQHILTS